MIPYRLYGANFWSAEARASWEKARESRKTMEEQRWCREEVGAEATFSGVLVRGKPGETSV